MRIQATLSLAKDTSKETIKAIVTTLQEIGEHANVDKIRVSEIVPQKAVDFD